LTTRLNGMSDGDIITIAGWEPGSAVVMLQRYGQRCRSASGGCAAEKHLAREPLEWLGVVAPAG
jgi:hypothetical protein